MKLPEPTDDSERKVIKDVTSRGWHVMKVLEDEDEPEFAYTIGLFHSFKHPELIVVGLPLDLAHQVLNAAGETIRRGAQYAHGSFSREIFERHDSAFRQIQPESSVNYLGWNLWFYDGKYFPALQLIWPDDEGRWPWDAQASEWARERQPLL